MSELSTALIALDGQIGVILNALDAAQLRQSTALIITAKHGNSPINRAILSRKSTVRARKSRLQMRPCLALAPCLHAHDCQRGACQGRSLAQARCITQAAAPSCMVAYRVSVQNMLSSI